LIYFNFFNLKVKTTSHVWLKIIWLLINSFRYLISISKIWETVWIIITRWVYHNIVAKTSQVLIRMVNSSELIIDIEFSLFRNWKDKSIFILLKPFWSRPSNCCETPEDLTVFWLNNW
jgi:hypothetical protein